MSRFSNVFNYKNSLWRTVSSVFDVMGLSLIWSLFCIPIITIGPATAALYKALSTKTRKMEEGAFIEFFRVFKNEFKKGIIPGLIVALDLALGAWCLWIIWQMTLLGQGLGGMIFVVGVIAFLVLSGFLSYILPTFSKYEYSLKELLQTCFMLSISHLPSTLLIAAITIVMLGSVILIWPLCIISPGLGMLILSFPLEKIYKTHTKEGN